MSGRSARVLLVEGSGHSTHPVRLAVRGLGAEFELTWAGRLATALELAGRKERLAPLQLRVAVDAALLTPLLFVAWIAVFFIAGLYESRSIILERRAISATATSAPSRAKASRAAFIRRAAES